MGKGVGSVGGLALLVGFILICVRWMVDVR